jgi:outer membrane protein assembly factor BamB
MFLSLELRTGRVRWETRVTADSSQYFFHGDPFIAEDLIVIGADRAAGASIHAFDRSTGKESRSNFRGWRAPRRLAVEC